jgi:4-amino-4-deoxy-L-arabinose transferase-like glycosyltransferase
MAELSNEVGFDRTDLTHPANYRKWRKLAIVLLLSLPVALAFASSLLNPLFESPDELEHYAFVRSLIDERKLPIQDPDGALSQFHQPPLYYLIGALFTAGIPDQQIIPPRNPHWTSYPMEKVHRDNKAQFLASIDMAFPFSGTALVAHVLRLWSVLLVAGTVVVIWQLGKELFPNDSSDQILFLAIATLIPMVLYIGGSVNNDNLVSFLGVLLIWLVIRAVRNGFDWLTTLLIGLVWGLALLSKLSAVMLVVPWGIALLWVSWQRRDWSLLIMRAATICGGALLLSSWWYIRNISLYGEPTGLEQMLDIWGERPSSEFLETDVIGALRYSWTSFWGRFGYGQIILPSFIYWFYGALVLLGLGGIFVSRSWWREQPGVWLVLAATLIIFFFGLLYYSFRSPTGANGRYTYPALPAFAAFLTAGLLAYHPSGKVRAAVIIMPSDRRCRNEEDRGAR